MTPERGQRVYAVFEAVLKCNAAVRAAVLEDLCAGDPELRAEVERLIAGDAQANQDRFLMTASTTEPDGPRPDDASHAISGFMRTPGMKDVHTERPVPAATVTPSLTDHPDYLIERELGRGGMGVVYLVQNRLLGRLEVLKVIGREIIDRPGALDRFLREMRAVAELRHPNIVTAYHATRLGESIVFAMEHVEGLDLSRLALALSGRRGDRRQFGYCRRRIGKTVEDDTEFPTVQSFPCCRAGKGAGLSSSFAGCGTRR